MTVLCPFRTRMFGWGRMFFTTWFVVLYGKGERYETLVSKISEHNFLFCYFLFFVPTDRLVQITIIHFLYGVPSCDTFVFLYFLKTAVVDSSEGAPAYQDVCRFFEQELKLTVTREMREVPVLLVVRTLNNITYRPDVLAFSFPSNRWSFLWLTAVCMTLQ